MAIQKTLVTGAPDEPSVRAFFAERYRDITVLNVVEMERGYTVEYEQVPTMAKSLKGALLGPETGYEPLR